MKNAKLTGGILGEAYEKLRRNFYEVIDEGAHAATYVGEHPNSWAEPEFSGKFLDVCASYYKADGDVRALEKARPVIESIFANQRADGYLGGLAPGNELAAFSVWNQAFTIFGLLGYWDVTGDGRVLASARRCADYICDTFLTEDPPDILNAGNGGSQHISVILAMAMLWQRTGGEKYRRFLERVFDKLEKTDMNLVTFKDILSLRSRKGIEMMAVYLGVMKWGEATGDIRFTEAGLRYLRELTDTQIRNTGNGTLKEVWTPGGSRPAKLSTEAKPNETCVAVGYSELLLTAFNARPEAEYLDALERTLFNHLLGALAPDGGDFAYYQGNYGKKQTFTAANMYKCCRYRAFDFFSHLTEMLYRESCGTIIPMIYAPSEYRSGDLTLTQETRYPAEGDICFRAENGGPELYLLRLRIPAWCEKYFLTVNGRESAAVKDSGFVQVSLPRGTTEVKLSLGLSLWTERGVIDGAPHIAAHYGPLLLAADSHYGPIESVSGEAFERVPADPGCLVRFVNGAVSFTDYMSAGGVDPAVDEFSVWVKKS